MLAAIEQVVHTARVLVLGLLLVEGDDAQVDLVLAHQGDGEAGKGAAKQYQGNGHDVENPEGAAIFFGDVVMVIATEVEGAEGSRNGRCGGETGEQGPGQA